MWLGAVVMSNGQTEEAQTLWRRAIETDLSEAQAGFDSPHSARFDFDEAERWLRITADAGSTCAQTALGNLLDLRDDSAAKLEALELWRRAASAGNARAQFVLSVKLRENSDSDATVEADRLLDRACASGNREAWAYRLSLLLETAQVDRPGGVDELVELSDRLFERYSQRDWTVRELREALSRCATAGGRSR
jgi:TPR repeat protein